MFCTKTTYKYIVNYVQIVIWPYIIGENIQNTITTIKIFTIIYKAKITRIRELYFFSVFIRNTAFSNYIISGDSNFLNNKINKPNV